MSDDSSAEMGGAWWRASMVASVADLYGAIAKRSSVEGEVT